LSGAFFNWEEDKPVIPNGKAIVGELEFGIGERAFFLHDEELLQV